MCGFSPPPLRSTSGRRRRRRPGRCRTGSPAVLRLFRSTGRRTAPGARENPQCCRPCRVAPQPIIDHRHRLKVKGNATTQSGRGRFAIEPPMGCFAHDNSNRPSSAQHVDDLAGAGGERRAAHDQGQRTVRHQTATPARSMSTRSTRARSRSTPWLSTPRDHARPAKATTRSGRPDRRPRPGSALGGAVERRFVGRSSLPPRDGDTSRVIGTLAHRAFLRERVCGRRAPWGVAGSVIAESGLRRAEKAARHRR
jgi:hypothetical protein